MDKVKAGFEQKEKLKMNLLTNFDDTLQAMGEIEGYRWLKEQIDDWEAAKKTGKMTELYVSGVLKFLDQMKKKIEEEKDEEEKKYLQEHLQDYGCVIYGDGGWNRWFVDGKGNVRFSKYNATALNKEKLLEKVQALGFEIR